MFVGVLDSGLEHAWRQYFPEERIAVRYAKTFVGGGIQDRGQVVSPPGDQWQHDVCSHGTHVTGTILGYRLGTTPVQGTAPKATVIPVRLHMQGSATARISCGFNSSVGRWPALLCRSSSRDRSRTARSW